MQLKIEESGTTAKVILTGRLDIPAAEVIALSLAVLAQRKSRLIIDMVGVSSIALIALRHFVSTSRWVKRRGGCLILLNPNSDIREIVMTAGLSELLHMIGGNVCAVHDVHRRLPTCCVAPSIFRNGGSTAHAPCPM